MLLMLEGAFVAATSAGLAAGLAWSAAGRPGPWPVTGALLLGPDDGQDEVDLRFRAFAAGAVVVVVAALTFQEAVRGAGLVRMALALALVLPVATVLLAAAADVGARLLGAWRARRAVTLEVAPTTADDTAADDPDDDAPEAGASLDDLIEEARLELREASTRVRRGHLQSALEALREVLDEYAVAAGMDGASPALRARVRGVAALARTCAEAEGQEALQLLGVRPDATPQEVAAVCRALVPLYRGPGALPGVDPARADALEAAAARLTRRAA